MHGPRHSAYYAGDSGTSKRFAHIGADLGPFDVTLLPIGAYDPFWPDLHLEPEQTVAAHRDVNRIGSAAEAFSPGDHGSTFGGGPVIAAAALATIDAMEAGGLGANAVAVGDALRTALARLARTTGAIGEVRGRGLMVAAELTEPRAQEVAAECLERGVVVNAIGERILRFLPPLVCSERETDILLDTLHTVLGAA